MVHFLRDENNRTLIECETYDKDLSTVINVYNYSFYLLNKVAPDDRVIFVASFDYLSEIRGAYFENDLDTQTAQEFVAEEFKDMAKKWNLNYVTD